MSIYQTRGRKTFQFEFPSAYKASGYERFIGRTINEVGMALVGDKNWIAAFDMFNALIALFPDAPQVYDSLAFAYFKQGNVQQASDTFARALKIKKDFHSDYQPDNYVLPDTE